jgi:hypothetical protein
MASELSTALADLKEKEVEEIVVQIVLVKPNIPVLYLAGGCQNLK